MKNKRIIFTGIVIIICSTLYVIFRSIYPGKWIRVQNVRVIQDGRSVSDIGLYKLSDSDYYLVTNIDKGKSLMTQDKNMIYLIDLPDREIDIPNQAGSDILLFGNYIFTKYRIPYSASIKRAVNSPVLVTSQSASFESVSHTHTVMQW